MLASCAAQGRASSEEGILWRRFVVEGEADIDIVSQRLALNPPAAVEIWIIGGENGYEHDFTLDALSIALEPLGYREPPEIGGPLWSNGGEGYMTLFVRDAQLVCTVSFSDWERAVAELWVHGVDCLCARDTNYLIYVAPEDFSEADRIIRSIDELGYVRMR